MDPPARVEAANRYVAFLRAINVGGHTVKMERLRALFESLQLANVETFIASGNVIFETPAPAGAALEQKIERHLRTALGYAVATFLRSPADLRMIAEHGAFPGEDAGDVFVAFVAVPLGAAQATAVGTLRNELNDFHVNGREVYWLRRERTSRLEGYQIEKTIGVPATMRNMTTVRRLVAKIGA